MSISIGEGKVEQEETVLKDLYGQELRVGTPVVLPFSHVSHGVAEGVITDITPRCIFIGQEKDQKYWRRRIYRWEHEGDRQPIVSVEKLKELDNEET